MTAAPIAIRADDLSGEQTQALIRLHLSAMHASSPPGTVFALDLAGLRAPGVTVWTAWIGDTVVGMAALKELGAAAGELKSMRTRSDFVRLGVAATLLEHIIAIARARGMQRLSLETGSGPAFEPALALYRKRGFIPGAPFAQYQPSPFSQFFHLPL